MNQIINEAIVQLTQYLYNELICIICSYLEFNTESLIFEKSFPVVNQSISCNIDFRNNKIYMCSFLEENIIIYDMKTKETFYLDTKLKTMHLICNIDDNNIMVGTLSGIYFYNYNIINKKINIISVKKKLYNYIVTKISYFENKIVVSTLFDIYIYSLKDDSLTTHLCVRDCGYDSIFLYSKYLYVFNYRKYSIKILDINDKSEKNIILSFEDFKDEELLGVSMFVDNIYIYFFFKELIYVFDHNGKFIRGINFGIPNLSSTFYINLDEIYLVQKIGTSLNLMILQQKFKYKSKIS